jgi:hypothetical protein
MPKDQPEEVVAYAPPVITTGGEIDGTYKCLLLLLPSPPPRHKPHPRQCSRLCRIPTPHTARTRHVANVNCSMHLEVSNTRVLLRNLWYAFPSWKSCQLFQCKEQSTVR